MGHTAAPSEAAGTLLLLRWCFHAAQFEMLSCWSITAMAHLPLLSPHLGKAVAAVASAVVEGVHATFLGTYDAAERSFVTWAQRTQLSCKLVVVQTTDFVG